MIRDVGSTRALGGRRAGGAGARSGDAIDASDRRPHRTWNQAALLCTARAKEIVAARSNGSISRFCGTAEAVRTFADRSMAPSIVCTGKYGVRIMSADLLVDLRTARRSPGVRVVHEITTENGSRRGCPKALSNASARSKKDDFIARARPRASQPAQLLLSALQMLETPEESCAGFEDVLRKIARTWRVLVAELPRSSRSAGEPMGSLAASRLAIRARSVELARRNGEHKQEPSRLPDNPTISWDEVRLAQAIPIIDTCQYRHQAAAYGSRAGARQSDRDRVHDAGRAFPSS